MREKIYKKNILISVIGNVLEFYDFTVYAYLAPVISSLFFPLQDQISALISTFAVFAIGYFIRPFGGFVFGHIGDKYGRSKALLISIFMMALPTVLVGLLPTYDKIGIWAPISLVALRLAQGLSAGGELTGVASYIYETSPVKRRGFWCSFVASSSIGGVLLGSLSALLINSFLQPTAITNWGWRLPFLLGFPLAILGIWMRFKLKETPIFEEILKLKKTYAVPVINAVTNSLSGIKNVLMINVFVSVSFFLLFVWMPSYLQTFLGKTAVNSLSINTITMFTLILLIPIFGWLSDFTGRKRMALTGIIAILILVYPLFILLQHNNPWIIFFVETLFILCMCCVEGVLYVSLAEFFSPQVRYSGISIGYNISTSLLGGTTPLVCTYLIHKTSILTIPAIYIMIACLLALPSFFAIKEPVEEEEEEEDVETGVHNS